MDPNANPGFARLNGQVISGAPTTGGPYAVGDYGFDPNGPTVWVCVVAGVPGSWLPISTGGGVAAPGASIATVAAVDSPSGLSSNFVCNGTNDEQVINTALSRYSHVYLMEGNFNLGAPIQMWYRRRLMGSGMDTVVNVVGGFGASLTGELGALSCHDNIPTSTTKKKMVSGSITSGQHTLTITGSPTFAAADATTDIMVVGAGVGGGPLHTTIASRSSSTQVSLTDAASTTVTGATVYVNYPAERMIVENLAIEGGAVGSAHGVHWNIPSQENVVDVDTNNRLFMMFIRNMAGDGIRHIGTNTQGTIYTHLQVGKCGGYGANVANGGDNIFSESVFHGNEGGANFFCSGGNFELYNCKTYYSKLTGASTGGHGFEFSSAARALIVGCTAQDNGGAGFVIQSSGNTVLSGCMADSNGKDMATLLDATNQCGFYLNSGHMTLAGCTSYDKNQNANRTQYGYTVGANFQHSSAYVTADTTNLAAGALSGTPNVNNDWHLWST